MFTGNTPDSQIAVLSGDTSPDTGNFAYVPTSTLTLLPSQTYWIAAAVGSGSNSEYFWRHTSSTAEDAGSTWAIGDQRQFGFEGQALWRVSGSIVQHVQIEASAVPEPSAFLFGLIVLPGFAAYTRWKAHQGSAVPLETA